MQICDDCIMIDDKETVFFSNTPKKLIQCLEDEFFFSKISRGKRRYLIIPSMSSHSLFLHKWASNPQLGIGMGVSFCTLFQFFSSPIFEGEQSSPDQWFLSELTIHIYAKLCRYLDSSEEIFEPLQRYLMHGTEERIVKLSQRLARLFLDYSLYGNFVASPEKEWQQRLLYEIFYEEKWPLIKRDQKARVEQAGIKNCVIALYVPDILPPVYRFFFSILSKSNRVLYFFLSPSFLYIEDALSEKEKNRLLGKWIGKGKKISAETEALFSDTNDLVSHFISLKKKLFLSMDQHDHIPLDQYDFTEPLWSSAAAKRASLLKAIKQDMGYLRNPSLEPICQRENLDGSLTFHVVSSKFREMQIVLLDIHENLKQTKGTLSDVCIVAPNMEEYIPYIHRVFGDEQQGLGYKITGVRAFPRSSFAAALTTFFSLIGGRFDAQEILSLLRNPSFYTKALFTEEEVEKIVEWIEKAKIEWGWDLAQRREITKNEEIYDRSFTWGVQKIFSRFLFFQEDPWSYEGYLPIEGISFSDMELFERFFTLLTRLQQEVSKIEKMQKASSDQWAQAFETIIVQFFSTGEDPYDQAIFLQVSSFLRTMRLSEKIQQDLLSFRCFKELLIAELQKKERQYHGGFLESLTFCSFQDFSCFPYKIIYLIGMNDSFPKVNRPFHLNLLDKKRDDYVPDSSERDRNAFLNVLLCCEEKLCISYLQEPKAPSVLVEELWTYLDKSYCYRHEKISPYLVIRHAPYGYDIQEIERYSGHLHYEYQAAKASFSLKEPSFPFFRQHNFEEQSSLSISLLQSLFAHPIRFFYQQVLRVFLDREREEEDFIFSSYKLTDVLRWSHHRPIHTIVDVLQRKSSFPIGIFRDIAEEKITKEVKKYHEHLEELAISKETIFDVVLEADCSSPVFVEEHLMRHPPVICEYGGKKIRIVGTLENVSSKGLILHAEKNDISLLKNIPKILVYLHLCIDFPHRVCFVKESLSQDFFWDKSLFEVLYGYYRAASMSVSPLYPFWAKALMLQDVEKMEREIQSVRHLPFEDPYLDEFLSQPLQNAGEDICHYWKEHFSEFFAPIQKILEEMR
ncbi:MAG: exodeoxyribonuclease V subunit gamma [Parachlamydiales bacterium]|nr:exodeoxyribonuclease V subunit gamma [Parachlamydiales bacterium]